MAAQPSRAPQLMVKPVDKKKHAVTNATILEFSKLKKNKKQKKKHPPSWTMRHRSQTLVKGPDANASPSSLPQPKKRAPFYNEIHSSIS